MEPVGAVDHDHRGTLGLGDEAMTILAGDQVLTTPGSAIKAATSDAIGTQYGNVQLKVTVTNGKITRIEALQLPSNDPKSQEIGAYAEPLLTKSALSKQDGTVDAVSGATDTSNGYAAALQSALDKATSTSATA